MVFNGRVALGVAELSANVCQYVACNPERLPSDQVLYLIFCFPFQQIRRLALCLFTVFCFPLPPSSAADPPFYYVSPTNSFYSSSSSSSSDSEIVEDSHQHPHLH